MNKYQRYIQKCVSEGRCPHCGKPCSPYYECADRRTSRKIARVLNQFAKIGMIEKKRLPNGRNSYRNIASLELIGRAKGYFTSEDDCRLLPRIGKTYIDYEAIIQAVIEEAGAPIDMDTINERAIKIIESKKHNKRMREHRKGE